MDTGAAKAGAKAESSEEDLVDVIFGLAETMSMNRLHKKKKREFKWSSDPEEDAELRALDESFRTKKAKPGRRYSKYGKTTPFNAPKPRRQLLKEAEPLPSKLPADEVEEYVEMSKEDVRRRIEELIKEELEKSRMEEEMKAKKDREDAEVAKYLLKVLEEETNRMEENQRRDVVALRQHWEMRNEFASVSSVFFANYPESEKEMLDHLDAQWERCKKEYNYDLLKKRGLIDF